MDVTERPGDAELRLQTWRRAAVFFFFYFGRGLLGGFMATKGFDDGSKRLGL